MKCFFFLAAFAASVNGLALFGRAEQPCCFHLNVTGELTGPLGQLTDGQSRVGDHSLNQSTFCINSTGVITDSTGKGCIITTETTQFQCDEGKAGTPGFSISSSGQLLFHGSEYFIACETGQNGGKNIYTTNSTSVTRCKNVYLNADSCANAGSAPFVSIPPAPGSNVTGPGGAVVPGAPGASAAASAACSSVTIVSTVTVSNCVCSATAAPGAPAGSATAAVPVASAPGHSSVSSASTAAPTGGAASASSATASATASAHTPVVPVVPVPGQSSSTSATTASASETSPASGATSTHPSTPCPTCSQSASASGGSATSAPSQSAASSATGASTPCPSCQSASTSTAHATTPCPSCPQSAVTSSVHPPSSLTFSVTSFANSTQGSSVPATSPATTPSTSIHPVNSTLTVATSTLSSTSTSCPTNLSGEFQFPHLIVRIDSAKPDTPHGTGLNGTINSTVATTFNFDIPQSFSGKTCSLIFLFPRKEELQTTSFSFSGDGKVAFGKLSQTVTSSTTENNVPSVSQGLGTIAISPGNSFLVSTFSCPAGQALAFEMKNAGTTNFEFFEDWNPSPLGLFITSC